MRKISIFAAALVLIAVGSWAAPATPLDAASTPAGMDPLQIMTNAKNLPVEHFVDYTLIFN